nr:MAG TPA_asm: hypothetical protein [Caudoviricetes sp.]
MTVAHIYQLVFAFKTKKKYYEIRLTQLGYLNE